MSLAYDRTGAGEPLVLLHGLGHRRQAWNVVIPRLAAERDVIAVDLPAMGESPPPAVGDYRTMADMVEKLVGELGLERPHVAGNSLGGLGESPSSGGRPRRAVRSATALSPAGFWNTPGEVLVHGRVPHLRLPRRQLPDRVADLIIGNRFAVSLFGELLHLAGAHEPM